MPDYGHPITFGLSLYPSVDQLGETRQLARAADEAGLDYLAIQDHAYNPEFLDVWTLISYLAAETDRISFVPDVADLQLRPPTILAKAAASLSVLSGGRIVLGVGGGASAGGIAAMGGTGRSGPEMVAFTEEALQIMRRGVAGGVVEFHSDQHDIGGYEAGPVPPVPIPLWLGSQGPRMLAVTGRSSDGWVSPLSTYTPPAAVPAIQERIDEAARAAGRDPAAVRRIYNVVGTIGGTFDGPGLKGDVATWVDTLTEWSVDLGFDTFIFWPMTAPLAQLEAFATEVVPAVRQRVSERRGRTLTSQRAASGPDAPSRAGRRPIGKVLDDA
jgi:alkanesulfonate monooxygenase SsuD/methylene tetrahydromethanopterin reductase-like flavin-dependent oxidoreductase (luciferase family)